MRNKNLLKSIFLISIFFVSLLVITKIFYDKNNFNHNYKLKEENEKIPFTNQLLEMLLKDPVTKKVPRGMFARQIEFVNKLNEQNKLLKISDLIPGIWEEMGPDNIGGNTPALVMDCKNHDIILAGSAHGGIWKTLNGGEIWSRTSSTPFALKSIRKIVQDVRPGKENIWYAIAGLDWTLPGTGYQGVFKSINNGDSWQQLESTAYGNDDFQSTYDLALDVNNLNEDIVYVAVNRAIKRSNDGGISWENVLGTPNNEFDFGATAVLFTKSGILYASGSFSNGGGMWRSEDGFNWNRISPQVFPVNCTVVLLKDAPSNPNVIYMLMVGSNSGQVNINGHQFWKYTYINGVGSGNGGQWENRSANLKSKTGIGDFLADLGSYSGYCLTLDVKPDDENFVLIGGGNLNRSKYGFSSTDNNMLGGESKFLHPDIQSGFFHPDNSEIYFCGTDGGIYKTNEISSDDVSNNLWPVLFETINNNYNITQFYTVALAPEIGSNLIIGGTQDNGTIGVKENKSWDSIITGDGFFTAIAPIEDDRIYTDIQNGYLVRSDRNFNIPVDITPSQSVARSFSVPFVLDPNNSKLLYFTAGTTESNCMIWRNNDAPNATPNYGWETLPQTTILNSNDFISAMDISQENKSNVLYYGTAAGKIYKAENINSMPEVKDVTPAFVKAQSGTLVFLDVDSKNSDKVIAVYGNYNYKSLWYSENGGETWIDVEGNLADADGPAMRCAKLVSHSEKSYVFVGTEVGLFVTEKLNGPNTIWVKKADDILENQTVTWMDYRESDATLAVATFGRGVFVKRLGSPARINNDKNKIPSQFILEQNYPNPFNPVTTISFNIPDVVDAKFASTTLKIYDIIGNEITTLINKELAPGNYKIEFNANGLASGVYYYRLSLGNFTETRKMILLK